MPRKLTPGIYANGRLIETVDDIFQHSALLGRADYRRAYAAGAAFASLAQKYLDKDGNINWQKRIKPADAFCFEKEFQRLLDHLPFTNKAGLIEKE